MLTTSSPDQFVYTISDTGCWLWAGYADKNGYGRIYNRAERQIEWAHRYSYARHKGPIPERHEVDHICQVTLCVNPEHLQALTKLEHARVTLQRAGKDELHQAAARLRRTGLTYSEIAAALGYAGGQASSFYAVQRAIEKGLVSPDDVPRPARLDQSERDEIRVLYALGIPQVAIGRFYEIDSSQVSRICNGMTSGHGSPT